MFICFKYLLMTTYYTGGRTSQIGLNFSSFFNLFSHTFSILNIINFFMHYIWFSFLFCFVNSGTLISQIFQRVCLSENTPGVRNLAVKQCLPCDKAKISLWEQRNACQLPDDVRSFYASCDGFKLTWSYRVEGQCKHTGQWTQRLPLHNLTSFFTMTTPLNWIFYFFVILLIYMFLLHTC